MKYPYTIHNGHGEELTFLRRGIRNGIEFLEVENSVSPGSGPPMHVHYHQDESLTIMQGTMGVETAGEQPRVLTTGESITFKRGVMHRFWNAGETTLKCIGEVSPPHNLEYFLTEIYRSTRSGNGKPGAFDSAFLLSRFKSEFDMQEIPGFVKNVVFPIILAWGKLRGQHKKFADAPSPIITK